MRKFVFVLFFLLFPLTLLADNIDDVKKYAEENNVKCYAGFTTSTLMFCGNPYYNEKGELVMPEPCNTITTRWYCDDGKTFTIKSR